MQYSYLEWAKVAIQSQQSILRLGPEEPARDRYDLSEQKGSLKTTGVEALPSIRLATGIASGTREQSSQSFGG